MDMYARILCFRAFEHSDVVAEDAADFAPFGDEGRGTDRAVADEYDSE